MIDEQENQSEESENRPLSDNRFNKALAVLFVLAIYLVIFLKILFIK
jgi:hypothetical protein